MQANELLYRVFAALLSILTGYSAAMTFVWLEQLLLFHHSDASMLFNQYVRSAYGHLLLLFYFCYGLPHLLVPPVAAIQQPFRRAAFGASAVGLSIASGISLLFAALSDGGAKFQFVSSTLLFGWVLALVAVCVFRLLTRPVQATSFPATNDNPALKRMALSVATLAGGCAVPCLLLLLGSLLFDRYDSPARWLPFDGFFIVFSLTGWFLFGLPILVLGPLRQRFIQPLPSALAGGAAEVVLIESYNRTIFVGGSGLFSLTSLAFDAAFGAVAFLIGGLTTYLYVRYLPAAVRKRPIAK